MHSKVLLTLALYPQMLRPVEQFGTPNAAVARIHAVIVHEILGPTIRLPLQALPLPLRHLGDGQA